MPSPRDTNSIQKDCHFFLLNNPVIDKLGALRNFVAGVLIAAPNETLQRSITTTPALYRLAKRFSKGSGPEAFQFRGEFKVNDCSLAELLDTAKRIISKNKLNVELQWVPRAQNIAGKLI